MTRRTGAAAALLISLVGIAASARPDMTVLHADPSLALGARTPVPVPPGVLSTLRQACFDCHSNETRWPWYSQISPVSWWLKSHVNDGRKELNFSEFATYTKVKKVRKLRTAGEEVKDGDMPLSSYLPMHPAAHMTDADRATFVAWTNSAKAAIEATMTPEEKTELNKHRRPSAQ